MILNGMHQLLSYEMLMIIVALFEGYRGIGNLEIFSRAEWTDSGGCVFGDFF